MTRDDKRLPIVFTPHPGEALDSWIEAYAWRMHTNSRTLLEHIGLTGATLAQMTQILRPDEISRLTAATRVSAPALTAMTLGPLDGIAATIDRDRRAAQHPPAWRRQRGSRYCPQCLSDTAGRWQLAWRLSWSAVCLTHNQLLADFCPGCQRRPSPHRAGNRSDLHPPGHCLLPRPQPGGGRHKPSCGHPLTTATTLTIGGPHIPAAQQFLNQLITSAGQGPAQAAAAQSQLEDLYLLALRSLSAIHTNMDNAPATVSDILNECGRTPAPFIQLGPVTADTIAVASALAFTAYQRDDATGNAMLAWITTNQQTLSNPQPHHLLARWSQCSPALFSRILPLFHDRLRPASRLHHSTKPQFGRRPSLTREAISRRAASLPGLFWPAWSLILIPSKSASYHRLTSLRGALSVLTAIPGTRLTHAQAAAFLGGYCKPASVGRALSAETPQASEAILILLSQLARLLDDQPAPIDYTRRRRLFSHATVGRAAYGRLARDRGWARMTQGGNPHPLHLRILDWHLTVILTGAHPHPYLDNRSDAWNPYLNTLPAEVHAFLTEQAQRQLAHHGISEPVTWSPPIPDSLATTPPGIHPDDLNLPQLADAVVTQGFAQRPFSRISKATGLGHMHIQLATQLAHADMPEARWAALSELTRAEITSGKTLRQLYEQQHMTVQQLAWISLQNQDTVRKTLIAQGTQIRSHWTQQSHLPRQWFETHYNNTGKSARQAAAEAGCCPNTLRRLAKRQGIPFGKDAPPANLFASWPTQPPATVLTAATLSHGLTHLHRVVTCTQHKTQRDAAAALGITEAQLSKSKRRIENATGIQIFKNTCGYILPTPQGEEFLHHASKALRGLERRARGWL